MAGILEMLTEEEAYLLAILSDESGLDQAEFLWYAADHEHGCFRAWPFQHAWWRNMANLQIDQCSRSAGKSLSIQVKTCAFPLLHAAHEMVITAPEGNHLQAVTDLIETRFKSNRFYSELLLSNASQGITHRPFLAKFRNGSRIMGRIPQRDGRGVKGCVGEGTLILTEDGYRPVEELKVGDLVATHTGEWKPIKYMHEDVNDCYEVSGQGSHPLVVSCDHRFYGAANIAGPKQRRDFSEGVYFEDVLLLEDVDFHWATPTEVGALEVDPVEFSGTASRFDTDCDEFWWLVGRYLADGHLTQNAKSGKERRVHWCVHPKDQDNITKRLDYIGLKYRVDVRDHSSANYVIANSAPLNRWLRQFFGEHADGKTLPGFAYGMKTSWRDSLLEGYLEGDGHFSSSRSRWEMGTASERLALGLQVLGQTVGYTTTVSKIQPKVKEIMGTPLKNKPKVSWRVHFCVNGIGVAQEGVILNRIKSVVPVGKKKIFNPVIDVDHSYISGSIVSHNVHPLWLEMDEAQDYPSAGWTEIVETLKAGHASARWRAHGVTKGIRDEFWKFTQPDSDWTVHRYAAQWRPTWSDQEREEKIKMYGSSNHPDYRRNVLGKHGDVANPLFVLTRLMRCVDLDPASDYNQEGYQRVQINAEMVEDRGGEILNAIDIPMTHKKFKTTWGGADIGFTVDPTEILIFQEDEKNKAGEPVMKLISRFRLERISAPDQMKVILFLIDFYNLNAFSMDKTGNGLPLFQMIQDQAGKEGMVNQKVLERIKGYNFSEKIPVDFDQSIDVDEFGGDEVQDTQIKRNVLEYSSDKLREYVDTQRLHLPDDRDLITEFQGQTYTYDKGGMDMYGRKKFSKGSFHALDAARMAVLGQVQYGIEAMLREHNRLKKPEPVYDIFLPY